MLMISTTDLLLYMPAVLALNLTPGNDMFFVLSSGLNGGPRAGVAASLGIALGSLIHIILAAIGLAALVLAHPLLLDLLRWGGCAYLLLLAYSLFQARHEPLESTTQTSGNSASDDAMTAFRQAVVVNLLNPKIIVFVLAFIPQFVRVENGSPVLQFLILGALLNIAGTPINATVGYFAGQLKNRQLGGPWLIWLRCISAAFFVFIAVRIIS